MASTLGTGLRGIVTKFDDVSGMGEIVDDAGRTWPFHCISIADGTRHIDVDTPVEFADGLRVARHEAVDIRNL